MKQAHVDVRLTVGLCNLAFITMLTYAVANSAAQSLYLSAYGSSELPRVWMGVGIASALATMWLGRLSQRYDVVRLFGIACRASAASLACLLVLKALQVPGIAFLLYVWKDVYIIVLVELFWTFANVVFAVRSASRTYGYFCAAGSAGSVLGNVALGAAASRVGTAETLWSILPLLGILSIGCRRLSRNLPVPEPRHVPRPNFSRLLATVRGSAYLPWLMVLVASVQGTLTLVDFRFSAAVEALEHTEIARTQALGNLYAVINALSFALQMTTAPLLKFLGLPFTLFLVPALLGLSLTWAMLSGGFVPAACCLVVGKCLDYSLFRAAKEILYIPLNYAEKTQGKALVDIFTYRTAKALVSLFLLSLPLVATRPQQAASAAWGLLVLWAAATAVILGRYQRLVRKEPPPAAEACEPRPEEPR